MLNLIRSIEAGISFIVVEAIAFFTHNGTAGLALSTTAAGIIYKIGVTQDAITASASPQTSTIATQTTVTPATTPAPTPTQLTLSVSNTAPKIGDSVTYSITGGPANGTAKLYQSGLPQNASGQIFGTIQLNANGSASFTATLSTAGPVGGVISAEGSISIYAFDSAFDESDVVTLT